MKELDKVRNLRDDDVADEVPPIDESPSSRNRQSLETMILVSILSCTDQLCAQSSTRRSADQICRPRRGGCARGSGIPTTSHGGSWSKQ